MRRKKSVLFSSKPPKGKPIALETLCDGTIGGEFIPASASLGPGAKPIPLDQNVGPVERMVYRVVYLVSFGCVFSCTLVGRLVPGRTVIVRGMEDGANAAKDAVARLDGRGARIRAAFEEAILDG